MTVLSDQTLHERNKLEKIITPYLHYQQRKNDNTPIISRGLSSYGYDVTLAHDVQIFSNQNGGIVDPKKIDRDTLVDAKIHYDYDGDYVLLPPNSYLLGHTVEHFKIPNDILVLCLGKSTYARSGIQINVTPIEPGFQGQVVIEISNATSLPVKVYINEGIAQFIFLQGDRPCTTSYADRQGKYQGQTGITHAKT